MRQYIVLMALSAGLAQGAHAQDATFAAAMQATNSKAPPPSEAAVRTAALALLQANAKEASSCVPTGVETEAPTPATADRAVMSGIMSGELRNVWLAYGKASGCPGAERQRFMIVGTADGGLVVRPWSRGESMVWPTLMHDTSAGAGIVALNAIKAVDPACDGNGMEMIGSKIGAKSADLSPDFYGVRYKGSWEEIWTFRVCNRQAEVPIQFKADGTGGAYTGARQSGVKVSKVPA